MQQTKTQHATIKKDNKTQHTQQHTNKTRKTQNNIINNNTCNETETIHAAQETYNMQNTQTLTHTMQHIKNPCNKNNKTQAMQQQNTDIMHTKQQQQTQQHTQTTRANIRNHLSTIHAIKKHCMQ